jgi:ubiquinone/menaquinone biosynthesis C-methylase UbiE
VAQLTRQGPPRRLVGAATSRDHPRRPVYLRLLDRLLYRHPFEGGSARRYARDERPAFGDLDERLLDRLAPRLHRARRLLDLGCGPGTFAAAAAARHPALAVIAVDPSRDFARGGVVRARGEALPFADRSMDVAVCLSSIRHVRDRPAALRELRRVVRDRLVIVELDPAAGPARVAAHADRLGSARLRRAFGPLVVRTAPPAAEIARLAAQAGFALARCEPDRLQPVYVMELA